MRLETRDLAVLYDGADRPALDGVSMAVPSGTFAAVLGPNGSGKSTLMRALLGISPTLRGVSVIGGKPVTEWSRRDLARAVGAVAQAETIAFPVTTTELVGMGRYPHLGPLETARDQDRTAIARALELCDLTDLADREVTTLSGGEFQRARIARALCQEPQALVLDEPTASLDIRHQMGILELLRKSADDGMTVLLVTHSLDRAAQFADRMVLLDEGRVAAEGSPDEVLTEETLARVYRWPVAIDTDPRTGARRITPERSTGGRDRAGVWAATRVGRPEHPTDS